MKTRMSALVYVDALLQELHVGINLYPEQVWDIHDRWQLAEVFPNPLFLCVRIGHSCLQFVS